MLSQQRLNQLGPDLIFTSAVFIMLRATGAAAVESHCHAGGPVLTATVHYTATTSASHQARECVLPP